MINVLQVQMCWQLTNYCTPPNTTRRSNIIVHVLMYCESMLCGCNAFGCKCELHLGLIRIFGDGS